MPHDLHDTTMLERSDVEPLLFVRSAIALTAAMRQQVKVETTTMLESSINIAVIREPLQTRNFETLWGIWLRSMPERHIVACDQPDRVEQVVQLAMQVWGPPPGG